MEKRVRVAECEGEGESVLEMEGEGEMLDARERVKEAVGQGGGVMVEEVQGEELMLSVGEAEAVEEKEGEGEGVPVGCAGEGEGLPVTLGEEEMDIGALGEAPSDPEETSEGVLERDRAEEGDVCELALVEGELEEEPVAPKLADRREDLVSLALVQAVVLAERVGSAALLVALGDLDTLALAEVLALVEGEREGERVAQGVELGEGVALDEAVDKELRELEMEAVPVRDEREE